MTAYCSTAASRRPGRSSASSRFEAAARSSTSPFTKAATGKFGACSKPSDTRFKHSCDCGSARSRSAISRSVTRGSSRQRNFPRFGALLPRMGSIALHSRGKLMNRISRIAAGLALLAFAAAGQPAFAQSNFTLAKLSKPGTTTHDIAGTGAVQVHVLVDPNGKAESVSVLKSTNAGDNAAAIEMARTATYVPAH